MKLYSYWRSTSAYRARIALNLKSITYETVPINLVKDGHHKAEFRLLTPSQSVPVLQTNDGRMLTQSLAILEWLEESHPTPPPLLPQDPFLRAQIRAAAQVIASDIHPINNLRVMARLRAMGHDEADTIQWMHHWMIEGLTAFQALIKQGTAYCFGDRVTFADICLIPQLYNARRWGLDLTPFEPLTAIEAECLTLPAFQKAHPNQQPDAMPEETVPERWSISL